MGVRPPAGDEDGEHASVEFGIADVERYLSEADVTFPASGEAVAREVGDPEIAYAPTGGTVRLSTVVERVDQETFESRQAFLNALHPVFEDLRVSRSGGVLSWLRSLLPGG